MNCEDTLLTLTDHHHEALPAEQARAVAEHLGTCGDCAQAYCRLQAQLRGIGAAYAERPSTAMREALRARVQAEFVPSRTARLLAFVRRPIPAYGAALAAAVPLVAWLAMRGAEAPESDRVPSPPAPARIHDYDATVPLLDPSVS